MSVLGDEDSVVSGSTNMTDSTHNLQITDLFENPKILQGMEKGRSVNTDRDMYSKSTDGCEMSPLVPLQMSKFTQQSLAMEDSGSEMSELLIPVISMKSSATVKTTCYEIQESQCPEESQSLLPQLPVSSCLSTVPGKGGPGNTDTRKTLSRIKNNADPSQSSDLTSVTSNEQNNNQSKAQEIFRKDTDSSNCTEMTVQEEISLKNKNCIRETFVLKSNELLDKSRNLTEHTNRSKKSDNLMEPQSQAMPGTVLDLQKDQAVICKMQRNINLSQSQSLSSGREGEIIQMSKSQRTVTLISPGKDPVDRIISRLDRLVSSLDKVPRRQKMVIEATVLQCITSLQDSLNNKLKKQSSAIDGTGTLRKLLQTTQNGLTKLTEQHKHEKSQLAQTGTQSAHQTRWSQQNQSGVNDLCNRQKKVLDLLKRQKHLVELYKTKNRPTSERNISVPANSNPISQRNAERSLTGNKIRSESGHESQGSREGKLRTEFEKGVIKTTSIKPDKRKKSRELQLKGTLDSTSLKDVVSNNFKDTGINHNVDVQFNDVCSRIESGDQSNTELQTSDFKNCVISQDMTTVPDTQDLSSTQDTFSGSMKDSSAARLDLAFDTPSADCPVEFTEKKDEGREILKEFRGKNETEIGASSRTDEHETNNRKGTYDGNELKGDKMENIESNGKVKKLRLNEDCVNDAVGTKDKANMSEILWLNMVKDATNKPVERDKETVLLTDPNQRLITARKVSEIKELPIRTGTLNVCNYNTEFTFRKPSLIDNTTLEESKNVFAVPNEERKVETCLNRKTKLFDDETRQNVFGKRIEESDNTNVKNGKVIDSLSSPPNIIHPGETWHNVSPTATSMSSDVFMVKMKDLKKRVIRRTMQSKQTEEILPLNAASKNNDSRYVHLDLHRQRISDQDDVTEKLGRDTENIEICNEESKKAQDTISEAIDSVIEQSRAISTRKKTEDINKLENIQMSEGAYKMGSEKYSEKLQPDGQLWKKSYINATDPGHSSLIDTNVVKGKNPLTASLPTLRDLVHSGQLLPGKAVLSCNLKGMTHRASLTPLGKIRTPEGQVFTTASRWVSTLTDGTPIKKRKAYEMVWYQNKQLLSFCKPRSGCVKVPSMPTTVAKEVHLQSGIPKSSVDQGVQVEESEFISTSSKMTEDEKRLNVLLSSSVIRLLTDKDLVPCDDLPDNFWTEDFSKVKLHKDIWDAVDAW